MARLAVADATVNELAAPYDVTVQAVSKQTRIHVDPDVPLVRITRESDAPPEKVFRALVDPGLFARWNGPKGMEARIDRHDCRTGGAYRYVLSEDGEEYARSTASFTRSGRTSSSSRRSPSRACRTTSPSRSWCSRTWGKAARG